MDIQQQTTAMISIPELIAQFAGTGGGVVEPLMADFKHSRVVEGSQVTYVLSLVRNVPKQAEPVSSSPAL